MTRGSPGSRAAALALLVVTLVAAYGLIGWPIQSAYQEALASIDDHRRGLSRLEAAQVRNDALARQLQSDTNGRTSPRRSGNRRERGGRPASPFADAP